MLRKSRIASSYSSSFTTSQVLSYTHYCFGYKSDFVELDQGYFQSLQQLNDTAYIAKQEYALVVMITTGDFVKLNKQTIWNLVPNLQVVPKMRTVHEDCGLIMQTVDGEPFRNSLTAYKYIKLLFCIS